MISRVVAGWGSCMGWLLRLVETGTDSRARNIDVLEIVNLLRRLLLRREGGRAMWAGIEPGIDDVVRARLQGTANPGAALEWRLVADRTIRLFALRRRQRQNEVILLCVAQPPEVETVRQTELELSRP